jgi:hypothetical protein
VCSGRDDELIRGEHPHHCGVCDSDWSHDGRCLEALDAWCPWCVPAGDAQAAGARIRPHFHYCSVCGGSWRHSTTCAEPFQAALPDCPGCVGLQKYEPDQRVPEPEVAREPKVARRGRAAYVRALVKPLALSFLLTTGVILAFQHALKAWPTFWTMPTSSSRALPAQHDDEPRSTPTQVEPFVAAAPSPPEPEPTAPRAAVSADPPSLPAPSLPARPRPAPSPPARLSPPRTATSPSSPAPSPPLPPLPSEPVAPPSVASAPSAPPEVLPPAPSPAPLTQPPSPPQREIVVTPPADMPPPPPAVQASVAEPSVPGGPPAGVLGGGSSWETLPDHHPRSTERRARLGNAPRY